MLKISAKRILINYKCLEILFSVNSPYGVDECADVCTANATSLGSLSNCTLSFTSTVPGAWYAIALQVNNKYSYFYICKYVTIYL